MTRPVAAGDRSGRWAGGRKSAAERTPGLAKAELVHAPKTDTSVEQFGELGSLESSKAVFEIIAPTSGTVVVVNADVVANPGLINEDPYGKGWLVEMMISNWLENRELLLTPEAYAKTVKHKAEEA